MEWGRSLMLTVVLQERGASDSREPEPRMGPDRTGWGLGGREEGKQMERGPREPY